MTGLTNQASSFETLIGGPSPARSAGTAFNTVERAVVATLTAWFLAVLGLGWLGVFGQMHHAAVGVIAVAELLGIVALYYLNPSFRAYVRSISFKHLTIFNVWRFPAGALFLYYGARGLLPPLFVQNAAWGDILAACLVPVVLMLPESRSKYLWFQVIGFADFILAVGTGLTLNVLDTPTMSNIAELPLCLIPLFGVPITGAVHIMMLDRLLLAGRRASRVHLPAGR